MYIIPAIDIIDGKCVRLTQGDYDQMKVYDQNPVEVAKRFENAGIKRLHLVDLDGAKSKHIVNYKTLEKIANETGLIIDFGGGIKQDEDLKIAFENGAHQVTVGTIAAKDPTLFLKWLDNYGGEKLILGADFKDGKIAVSGWQENSDFTLFEFLEKYAQKGVQYVICTDVSKDGLLQGSSTDTYKEIRNRFPRLKLIASGGVTTLEEIKLLEEIGCYGSIIGKAIYEGKIKIENLI